jgi:predicted MFS family arabinose efflux permease
LSSTKSIYGRAFWLVFFATFALNCCSNLFALFPLWVVDLGGGVSTIGALVGTGPLFALLARPYVGSAIDRRGRRATSLWFLALYAVRAIHGAVEGTARVALFAMVFDLLPEGREGEAMTVFSLSGMGPASIAPLFAEILIKHSGFTAFFLSAVALVAIATVLAMLLPDDRLIHHEQHEAPRGPSYVGLMRDAKLQPLWVVTLLFSLAISSRLSFVAPFAYQKGISTVGVYFVIYALVGVVVRIVGRRVLDRVGLGRVLVPSLVILAIGMAMIAGTGHAGVLDVAAVIGGFGHGYLYPALSALVIARTDLSAMGRSSSIYTSLYDAGTMAGPYVLGIVGESFGYGPLFIVSGAFSLIGGGYFVAMEPESLRAEGD